MPTYERKLTYKNATIKPDDILFIVFRYSGVNTGNMVMRGRHAMKKLLYEFNGQMPLEAFAKAADYKYENAQDKYNFKKRFLVALHSAGLIEFVYDGFKMTHIRTDRRFLDLMMNFHEAWKGMIKNNVHGEIGENDGTF